MALENPDRASGRGGGGSFLAIMLLERFAGEMTGSPPGQEMLRAVEAARAVGARVAFVDLPIGMTVGSLRKLPLREKLRLGVDSLISIALLPFSGFNLSKLTEDLEEEFMAARIRDVMYSTAGPVVAVVGYGHLKSLAKALAPTSKSPVYSTRVTWNVSTS